MIPHARQGDPGTSAVRVHRHVAQRLLGRAVQAQGDVARQVVEGPASLETDLERVLRVHSFAVGGNGRVQPRVLEDTWME